MQTRIGPLPTGGKLQGGRYVVEATLGEDSLGITYRATDTSSEQAVAIKELYPAGSQRIGSIVAPPQQLQDRWSEIVTAYVQQANARRAIIHPHLASVVDCFAENNSAYVVSEFVAGASLAKRLAAASGPLAEEKVVRCISEVGAALAALHANGLPHLDIKPANIIVNPQADAILVGFGPPAALTMIAPPVANGLTAPEALLVRSRRGPASDIYALAATAFYLLTAAPPELDEEGTLKPDPHLSSQIYAALKHGMAFSPTQRPRDVASFAAELRGDAAPSAIVAPAPGEPVSAPPSPEPTPSSIVVASPTAPPLDSGDAIRAEDDLSVIDRGEQLDSRRTSQPIAKPTLQGRRRPTFLTLVNLPIRLVRWLLTPRGLAAILIVTLLWMTLIGGLVWLIGGIAGVELIERLQKSKRRVSSMNWGLIGALIFGVAASATIYTLGPDVPYSSFPGFSSPFYQNFVWVIGAGLVAAFIGATMLVMLSRLGWRAVVAATVLLLALEGAYLWLIPSKIAPGSLNSVHMVSANEGWAVGGPRNVVEQLGLFHSDSPGSSILHYQNGQWAASYSPDWYGTPNEVYMISADEGWAISYNAFWHYSGGRWSQVSSPTQAYLTSLQMFSATDGWAAGNNYDQTSGTQVSYLLHYTGGKWIVASHVNLPLDNVYMLSDDEGWATGFDGTNQKDIILHYRSGDWATAFTAQSGDHLRSIYMTSANEGWAVGDEIVHYDGSNWSSDNRSYSLNSVFMLSPSDGWALGNGGTIMHYDGSSWSESYTPDIYGVSLHGVYMVSPYEGWAVGYRFAGRYDYGVIFHYQNGEWSEYK